MRRLSSTPRVENVEQTEARSGRVNCPRWSEVLGRCSGVLNGASVTADSRLSCGPVGVIGAWPQARGLCANVNGNQFATSAARVASGTM